MTLNMSLSVPRTVIQDDSARELITGTGVGKLCKESPTYRAVSPFSLPIRSVR